MKETPISHGFHFNHRVISITLITTISLLGILISPAPALAIDMQENILKGRITDAYTGNPLAGVTIQVEGTETKAESGEDGTYSITLPENAKTLSFTFAGYQILKINIDGRKEINAVMSPDYDDPPQWYF